MKKHLIKYFIHSVIRVSVYIIVFTGTFYTATSTSSKSDNNFIIIETTVAENNQETESKIVPLHDLEELDIDLLE